MLFLNQRSSMSHTFRPAATTTIIPLCFFLHDNKAGDHDHDYILSFLQTIISNGEAQEGYTYDLWDANKMRSCWCNRSMAVDNMFSGISTTHRGPYALADTDSYGYDCSLGRSDKQLPGPSNSRLAHSGFAGFALSLQEVEFLLRSIVYDCSYLSPPPTLGAPSPPPAAMKRCLIWQVSYR